MKKIVEHRHYTSIPETVKVAVDEDGNVFGPDGKPWLPDGKWWLDSITPTGDWARRFDPVLDIPHRRAFPPD